MHPALRERAPEWGKKNKQKKKRFRSSRPASNALNRPEEAGEVPEPPLGVAGLDVLPADVDERRNYICVSVWD